MRNTAPITTLEFPGWQAHAGKRFTRPWVGLSRAPGLPQATARRICGRGPHPLCTVSIRRTQARGGQAGGNRCRGRVHPVCRFQSGSGASYPRNGNFGGVGPCVGRWLSGTAMMRRSWPSRTFNSRRRTPPGSPLSGTLGAFDFSTRIKGGGRKRPPPGHKAPRCGAFPAFAEGAPFRHSRRF